MTVLCNGCQHQRGDCSRKRFVCVRFSIRFVSLRSCTWTDDQTETVISQVRHCALPLKREKRKVRWYPSEERVRGIHGNKRARTLEVFFSFHSAPFLLSQRTNKHETSAVFRLDLPVIPASNGVMVRWRGVSEGRCSGRWVMEMMWWVREHRSNISESQQHNCSGKW